MDPLDEYKAFLIRYKKVWIAFGVAGLLLLAVLIAAIYTGQRLPFVYTTL